MSRSIMHVDLDAFFVTAELRDRPELRGKPVVVGGQPDRRGVVAAASYEARKFGLHSGMALATAYRLCPQATFIEGDFRKYREASRKFMAILADFSPAIEPMGIDEAYLDVTGFESQYGTLKEMAARIKARVREETGLVASVGIASNQLVAKVASDHSKPDGLLEIAPGQEAAFLAPLKVDDLPGVGKKTGEVLRRLGVKTIGQMAQVPIETLKRYFGSYGESLQRHARGMGSDRLSPPTEAKSISRETTFPEDTRDLTLIKASLSYLAQRVGRNLREEGKQARTVTIKLRYSDFTTVTRQKTLDATSSDQIITEAGLELLERMMLYVKQPIRLVGIGVSNLVEPATQLDMLNTKVMARERLSRQIDRIRRKYGFGAIMPGRTLPLRDFFPGHDGGFTLHTPGLSR
ncbi:MAG: DNA polymerase IV [Dehalococcoidia bacterium]|nr:MAG: DNA polymerase IV [Dehalococcoidia bacterium]